MTRPADIYWDFEKDVLVYHWLSRPVVKGRLSAGGFHFEKDYITRYQLGYLHWSEIVPLNEGVKLWLMMNWGSFHEKSLD